MYHGYVPGIIWLQVVRDGIPQLVGTFPLSTGTAVHVLCCIFLLPSIETLLFSLFCDHWLDFREMNQCENIIIIRPLCTIHAGAS